MYVRVSGTRYVDTACPGYDFVTRDAWVRRSRNTVVLPVGAHFW